MRVTLADAGEGGEPTVSRTEASPSYPPTPSLPGQALVPWRYVEGLNDARTPLAGFFSILINQIRLRNIIERGGSVTAREWGIPWEGTALV